MSSSSRTPRVRDGSENLDFAERVCLSYSQVSRPPQLASGAGRTRPGHCFRRRRRPLGPPAAADPDDARCSDLASIDAPVYTTSTRSGWSTPPLARRLFLAKRGDRFVAREHAATKAVFMSLSPGTTNGFFRNGDALMSSMMAWRAVLSSMGLVGSAAATRSRVWAASISTAIPPRRPAGAVSLDPGAGEGGGAGEGEGDRRPAAGGELPAAPVVRPFALLSRGRLRRRHARGALGAAQRRPPGRSAGGELVFEPSDPEPGQHTSVISKARYDPTGCHIAIEVVSGFNPGSNAYAHVSAVTEDAQYIEMGFSGTQLDIEARHGAGTPILTWSTTILRRRCSSRSASRMAGSPGKLPGRLRVDGAARRRQHDLCLRAPPRDRRRHDRRRPHGARPGCARFDHLNVLP